MIITNPAIPLDSIVVVIGANGYAGAETCQKLLEAGFRVRGTVRDVERHRGWMHALFDKKWPGKFELVRVTDFAADGAFDEAFQGATGVIYVSTPTVFDPDSDGAIGPIVKGTIKTLEAAARAGVKRYVLSSSSKAVESAAYNHPHELTEKTFNHEAIAIARDNPPADPVERAVVKYSAGRTEAELAFWDWVKANDTPLVANCVVPDGLFGRILDTGRLKTGFSTSIAMLQTVLRGSSEGVMNLAYFIDVQDAANLLVAAVALPSLTSERIFAYRYNAPWNDLRHRIRELYPDRPDLVTGEDIDVAGRDLSTAEGPIRRAEEILKEVGLPGYTSLDDMLRGFVDSVYPSQ
ncbi:related to aldehyde reductase II [Cephalotrichum gorgonifer]|uniref:Related to aldehyde reductase II n=1 Tax=Cephalotrichum gorgonifer TaxID=2041049 RepID=A0AAE8N8V4_9PEZI|nr:related to aldehyde reductase II [Cephalotrichum gorgonifer]